MRTGPVLTAIAASALLLPATAAAQGSGSSLPSDGSALDQYVESIPDGQGGRPSNDVSDGDGSSSGSPPVGGGLQDLGPDGAAAAQLASATAPAGSVAGGGGRSGGGGGDTPGGAGGSAGSSGTEGPGSLRVQAVGDTDGDSAGEAIGSLLGGGSASGDLGYALPLFLLTTLLAALTIAAWRSSRARRSERDT